MTSFSSQCGKIVLLAGLALALVACGKSSRNPFAVTVSRCPAIAVVAHTGSLVHFNNEQQRTTDVLYEAQISEPSLTCEQGQDVVSEVSFRIDAVRGAALDGPGQFTIPYFVTVLRDNSQIVAKRVFEATVRFDPDDVRAGTREVISQRIPSIEKARRYDYEVLVGFQLFPEEVAYNMLR